MSLQKKARVALGIVAAFAVVAGAFAFKARTTDHIYFTTVAGAPATATLTTRTLTPNGAALGFTYATDVKGDNASQTPIAYYTGL